MGSGSPSATTTTTAGRISSSTRSGPTRSITIGGWNVRGRHSAGGRFGSRLRIERELPGLRSGRRARPVRVQLRRAGRPRRTSSARSTARTKSYCTPESYQGATNRLFRNLRRRALRGRDEGGGRLQRIRQIPGRRRLRPRRRRLARSSRSPTIPSRTISTGIGATGPSRRSAARSGVAFSESGAARGGMGIDAGDYDGVGRESLVIGNFSNEMVALYHNEGSGLYVDDAASAGVGLPSLLTLAFGSLLLRLRPGRASRPFRRQRPRRARHQHGPEGRDLRGEARTCSATSAAAASRGDRAVPGEDLRRPIVARGAAYADYDDDGDLDILVTTNGGPAPSSATRGERDAAWLRVPSRGGRAPATPIGLL